MFNRFVSVLILVFALQIKLFSQQVSDTTFVPEINKPEYGFEKGPVIFIDEYHNNFHTKNGRYRAFSKLLERDGYIVNEYKDEFEEAKLSGGKILVIANALNDTNVDNWALPTPSAFTKEEIEIVKKWVMDGGSLFLIADHMPFAGASMELASAFGFEFTNGFAFDKNSRGPSFFALKDGTLKENLITRGRDTSENVQNVVTFTGQAFKIPEDAKPILVFNDNFFNFMPDTAWIFNDVTPKYNIDGLSQGAFKNFGKGKIVAFGEAAMFTAQLAGPNKSKVGMNSEFAKENYKLLLNIIHWLDGKLN
jgi:hypothetical protein